MHDNPSPDDVFRYLKKMLEDLAGEMGTEIKPHFVGYTIISTPGEAPRVIRLNNHSSPELPYELVEGPSHYYITIELPTDLENAPVVDIDQKKITVQAGGDAIALDLPKPVDRAHCSYEIRRGLLDIVCQKL